MNEGQSESGNATKRRTSVLRIARRVFFSLLAIYLLILLLLMFLEESLIFFPSKYPDGDWNPPGLTFEDAWFEAADGTKLHGWYVPHDRPRAVVLFAHGNGGNISHRGDLLQALNRLGVAVLAFDYRGYGRSEGKPNEAGVLADGRAARTWLAERAGVPEKDVVLMGESLGGGVAVGLAAEAPARGLVLENTFSSIPEVAAAHYPGLPVKMLMRTRFDSAAAVENYHGPLLQFHGDCDTIVPYALGKKLFDAANDPKKFVTITGCDHNDARNRQFYEELDRFIDELNQPSN
jgi:fermentation-respiration switch protein FrsA (DUF1100 family)